MGKIVDDRSENNKPRLSNTRQLKVYLAQRYQPKIAEIITELLTPYFTSLGNNASFVPPLHAEEYVKAIAKFANDSDEGL